MARPFRTLLYAGAAAVMLQAPAARAADVSSAQAAQVEGQVRDWLGSIMGPAVKLSERPVVVTPAGDHFDVAVPIKVQSQGAGSEIRIMATARPLDGGKWAIEQIRASSPIRFSMDMPVPPKDGAKDGAKTGAKTGTTARVDYTIEVTGQDGQMTLDPSFSTPSTWTISSKGVTTHATGPSMVQDSRIGATNTVATIKPAGPDRVDVSSEGTLSDYTIDSRTEGLEAIQVGMRLVRVSAGMTGLSRTRAVTVTQGLTALVAAGLAALPGAGAGGEPPKIAPEVIRTLLGALQDFASEMNVDEAFEGLSVKYGDYAVAMEKARLGFGAKSDRGILQARMDLGVEGLALPDMPLGGMEALLPRRIALRPFVSGVGVAELMRMAAAGSEKKDPAPADIAALFSHGGIVAGLESLAIEMGGAVFTGQGKVTATSPSSFGGTAQLTAENFDGLMQKVSSMPPLAQAIPVMAFVKGIGRNVENRLVWDITYKDNKMLVNNVDLSTMMGGAPPAAGPQKGPPPRQNQNQNQNRPRQQ